MHSTFHSSLTVFLALTHRSYKMIRSNFSSLIVDGIVLICVNAAVFGYLFPAIGMSSQFIAPAFLGSTMRLFLNIGYGISLQLVNDITFKRYIDYLLTLPMGKNWLISSFVLRFAIELIIITLPLLAGGLFLLSNKISLTHAQWPLFAIIYLMTVLFFAMLFAALAFLSPYDWFMRNLWPRRLAPMMVFSSALVPWKPIYALSPAIAIPFLLNPITYISEGLRSSLLESDNYISPMICLGMLLFFITLIWFLLRYAFNKSLNPV